MPAPQAQAHASLAHLALGLAPQVNLTLDRAQGQTLQRAGMHLETSVFSHGHFCVGAPRCGDPDEVSIYVNQDEFESLAHLVPSDMRVTRNIVFSEAFDTNNVPS